MKIKYNIEGVALFEKIVASELELFDAYNWEFDFNECKEIQTMISHNITNSVYLWLIK